jgi:presenilin-like A22 family membrane protease
VPRVWSHNLTIILGLAGVGAAFGLSLPVAAVLLILFLLSIYDYIAVYKTDYMVTMFRGLMQRGAIFAAVLPVKMRGWFVDLNKVKPGNEFVFLGTGDMVLPLILSASAVSYSFVSAVFSLGGSLFGLVVLHILFTSQKRRAPMPALPPLALFAALGFVISLLIK